MFSFFKKKSKPAPEPESTAPEAEVKQPGAPVPDVEPNAIEPVHVAEPVEPEPIAAPIEVFEPEPVAAQAESVPVPVEPKLSWAQRLKQGLAKTRNRMGGQISSLFGVGRKIDAELFDELETILITADIGVDATQSLLDTLQKRVRREGWTEASDLQAALKQALVDMLSPLEVPLDVSTQKPFILMLAGVNGAGKTTTIGKLAKLYQSQGLSVLLAAGDTFRAAAREQLQVWGERNNVTVVSQDKGDSAAVIFDAIQAARARNIDVVLADTAGRLPTQLNLMEEIKKVKRVIEKTAPGAPHEILLVLDANTGQNAVAQVKAFDDALGVTGLTLTKLDGTAKGGAIAAIAHAGLTRPRPIPVRYIGVGEGLDDLRPFDAREFVDAVFSV